MNTNKCRAGGSFALVLLGAVLTGCHAKMETVPERSTTIKTVQKDVPAAIRPLSGLKITAKEFIRLPEKSTKLIALTFDAGSDDRATRLILKELTSRHVRATFFLTGKFCEEFPASSRAIADAGMEIGSHSYSHPHFPRLNDSKIKSQMERGQAAIMKICGRDPKPLFRFPYGDSNPRVRVSVAATGYQSVYWSLDSLDAFREKKSADFVAQRINSRIKTGDVVLMHVSSVGSAQALPRIFAHLEAMGAQVVPISEMLRLRK